MPTTLFAAQQHHAFGAGPPFDPDVHYIHSHPDNSLYIISESDYVSALIPSQRTVCAKQAPTRYLGPPRRIALQQHGGTWRKDARPLMAAVLQQQTTMRAAHPISPTRRAASRAASTPTASATWGPATSLTSRTSIWPTTQALHPSLCRTRRTVYSSRLHHRAAFRMEHPIHSAISQRDRSHDRRQ
jgi:hypothetical protein